jgi:asparagine synthase (glutamine-hydrolysing)
MTVAATSLHTRTRCWPVAEGDPPYFLAERQDGHTTAQGDFTCQLGSRYQASSSEDARGVFASWSWDGETLTAEVDKFGFFNLFYSANSNTVSVSPSLLQLIAKGADATVDRRALGVFYRLGLFIENDTPFKNIRALPPGGKLVWNKGTLTVTGAPHIPKERQINRADAVDGFISLTRQSVSRILKSWPGEIVLPLSGGRDSRHILLEMQHLGRLPETCVTFHHGGNELNSEARAARAICESVGVEHTVLGHPRSRPRDLLRTLVLTNLCSDEHAQMMPLHDFLMHSPCAALDGIAGDILTNPDDSAELFFQLATRNDFSGIARRLIAGHGQVISRPAWGVGAGPIYSEGRDEETIDYVAESIASFAPAPDPYQAFWFWNRTRREIGFVTTSIFASAQAVFCPYLDPDFVEFGLSLPYSVTQDQQLHNDAIAKAYPAYRHVPYQEGFATPHSRRKRPLHKLANVVDGIRVLSALEPQRPIKETMEFLKGSRELHRAQGDIYRTHALCLESLDAAKAKRLLALNRQLQSQRSKDVVTERFVPQKGREVPYAS